MGKVSKDRLELLPEFQKFLSVRKLAPEKNTPFLAYWVSRFLEFSRKHDYQAAEYQESAVLEFLDILRRDKRILDWQPRQAEDAIKLYYFHYLGKAESQLSERIPLNDISGILKEVRRLIRLKHYSYSKKCIEKSRHTEARISAYPKAQFCNASFNERSQYQGDSGTAGS